MAVSGVESETDFDVRRAFSGNSDEAEFAETAGYYLTGCRLTQEPKIFGRLCFFRQIDVPVTALVPARKSYTAAEAVRRVQSQRIRILFIIRLTTGRSPLGRRPPIIMPAPIPMPIARNASICGSWL